MKLWNVTVHAWRRPAEPLRPVLFASVCADDPTDAVARAMVSATVAGWQIEAIENVEECRA